MIVYINLIFLPSKRKKKSHSQLHSVSYTTLYHFYFCCEHVVRLWRLLFPTASLSTRLSESHVNNITVFILTTTKTNKKNKGYQPNHIVVISAVISSSSQCLQPWADVEDANTAPLSAVLLHALTGVEALLRDCFSLRKCWSQTSHHWLTPKCMRSSTNRNWRREKEVVSLQAAALARRHQNERGRW